MCGCERALTEALRPLSLARALERNSCACTGDARDPNLPADPEPLTIRVGLVRWRSLAQQTKQKKNKPFCSRYARSATVLASRR